MSIPIVVVFAKKKVQHFYKKFHNFLFVGGREAFKGACTRFWKTEGFWELIF